MNIDINEELRKHLLKQQERRERAEKVANWLAGIFVCLGLLVAVGWAMLVVTAAAVWAWRILFG